MKRADRKTKVEAVLRKADVIMDPEDTFDAWFRLCEELRHMTEPEARPPRFNRLLRAIWVAATNEPS